MDYNLPHIKELLTNYIDKVDRRHNGLNSIIMLDCKVALVFSMINYDRGDNIEISYIKIFDGEDRPFYKAEFEDTEDPHFKNQVLDLIIGVCHVDGVLEELQFKLEELILKEL